VLQKKKSPTANKKGRNKIFRLRRKMLRAQNRVLRCAQLGSPRLLRKTAIWDKMLRQRNSATANYDPDVYQVPWYVQWIIKPGRQSVLLYAGYVDGWKGRFNVKKTVAAD